MRLFHFTTEDDYEQIAADGFADWTSWGTRRGVELSESTRTDARTAISCWLLVIDIEEERIAPYERRQPASRLLRSALAASHLGPHGREWLVPAELLNEHGRIVDVGDFSDPAFADRYGA